MHLDANATSLVTNYCFPGDSDPLNWGTVSAGGGLLFLLILV